MGTRRRSLEEEGRERADDEDDDDDADDCDGCDDDFC